MNNENTENKQTGNWVSKSDSGGKVTGKSVRVRGKLFGSRKGYSRLKIKNESLLGENSVSNRYSVKKGVLSVKEDSNAFLEISGVQPIASLELKGPNWKETKFSSMSEELTLKLEQTVESLEKKVLELADDFDSFKRESYKNSFLLQNGATPEQLPHVLPIKVYLSNEDESGLVEEAIKNLVQDSDGEFVEDYEPIFGSWYKEWFAKIFNKKNKEQLEKEILKTKKALEVKHIEKPQSEVDLNYSTSVMNLSKAVEKQDYAVINVGNIFVIKFIDGSGKPIFIAKKLNVEQMIWFNENEQFVSQPELLADKLATLEIKHKKDDNEIVRSINS